MSIINTILTHNQNEVIYRERGRDTEGQMDHVGCCPGVTALADDPTNVVDGASSAGIYAGGGGFVSHSEGFDGRIADLESGRDSGCVGVAGIWNGSIVYPVPEGEVIVESIGCMLR